MSKLPAIKPKDMCHFIESLGYECVRQRGSHRFYKHPKKLRYTTIPVHNTDLGKGLLRKILKDIDQSPESFLLQYNKK